MKKIVIVLLALMIFSCKNGPSLAVKQDSKLIELFRASNDEFPKISVHRGGKGLLNYPENCLETIQSVSNSIHAIYEIDVAQTKDGQLVLMHDNSIDRTTNGSGLVNKFTYDQLSRFNLIDDFKNETAFKIPLFIDVLNWCRDNNVILTIDIKRGVSQKAIIDEVRKAKAEDISIIITYDLEQAIKAYSLAPDLLLSVSARNDEEFNSLIASKIPTKNMLAFTGTRLSQPSLFKRIHAEGIACMLGTLGNLDKQAEARGDSLYVKWKQLGVDILATDRPFEAYRAITNEFK